jgi:DNA-binding NarL/FixJ family response regulator
LTARILIADDHRIVREQLRSLLEAHEGWEVCGEAADGREALAKSLELRPDLLIIDLVMPMMDGFQAAREISKALPAMPILMHTQQKTTETIVQARKAGVRKVVIKGEPAENLLQAIEELLLEAHTQGTTSRKETQEMTDGQISALPPSSELRTGAAGEAHTRVPELSAMSEAAPSAPGAATESPKIEEKDNPQ